MDVYCDNHSCVYCCEAECQRTSIVIHGGRCISAEIRKAPAGVTTEQEHE